MPYDRELADILKDYVHKSEHNELLEAYNSLTDEHTALTTEVKQHRTRVAEQGTRANRQTFDALIKNSRVDPQWADEVFELAKLTTEKDELAPEVMKQRLTEYLEKHPKFLKREPTTPPSKEPPTPTKPATAKPTKPTESELIDKLDTRFKFNHSDLSNHEWCRVHGDAFAAAMIAGTADRIGD